MAKTILIVIIGIIALIIIFVLVFRPGGEDSWIKDKRGVWIKHGVPPKTPEEVREQEELLKEAKQLCENKKTEMQLESQCLGTISDYVVDIVSVPRSEEDNLPENQCQDYREGKAGHFIELDKEGGLVRVV